MSADDPKPETLADEETAGGPPQDELDAKAPSQDAAAEAEAPEADAPEAGEAPEAETTDEPEAEAAPKPKRTRAKKAQEPPKEEATPAKAAARSNGEAQVVRAHAKYVRTSARKARLVCDHLRGKSVEEARAILLHTPRHVARDWSKLLESAVANAEHNHELVGDELRILSITADEGPTIKRFRPRAMGRATPIRKRTSHLSIALTSKES